MDWMYLTGTLVRELNTNRLRRFLSTLGVIIGTAAVISSLAVVEGARTMLQDYLNRLGVNIVFLEDRQKVRPHEDMPGPPGGGPEGAPMAPPPGEPRGDPAQRMPPPGAPPQRPDDVADSLTLSDIEYLRVRFPNAAKLEPQSLLWSDVARIGEKAVGTFLEGGTPAGCAIRNLRAAQGRPLCDSDLTRVERVCVLGAAIAHDLFRGAPAVGQQVWALGCRWSVVGVLEPKGSLMRFDYDRLMIVPLTALQERTGSDTVNGVLISARNPEAAIGIYRALMPEALSRLEGRKREDFQVFCQDELMKQRDQTLRTFKVLTVAIAAFSLLVSGIGIMNIMMVSVRERTREIGVWKAVGATDGDVLVYFLSEAVLTCMVGGILGIFLGIVLGMQATQFMAERVVEVAGSVAIFRPQFFILAFGTSALVGLLSGIFPAYVAARLDPTEALRRD